MDPAKSRAWCEYLSAHFAQFEQAVPAQLLAPYASFTDSPDLLDVILATRPAVVSFHFGLPPKSILQILQRAKIPYWVSVTRLSEALYAQQQGCSAIIAQGIEAGGHRATFDPLCDAGLSTRELLQQLAPQISLPIISAGGVMTGGQINQLLTQGASAAQLGTAFMACRESAASDQLRQRLSKAKSTQITDVISGRPARGVMGRWQQEIDSPIRPPHAGYPYSYALAKQLDKIACAQGVTDYQVCWAGTGVTALRPLDAILLMQTLIAELQ